MNVLNQPKNTGDPSINAQRDRIVHRGLWMGLLLKQMKEKGLDWKQMGTDAIFECGCIHGEAIKKGMAVPGSMVSFCNAFFTDNIKKIFEIDVKELNENVLKVEYGHCPLLTAWQSIGFEGDELDKVCDIAMDGDRGIASRHPEFEFKLGRTLAQGHKVCEVSFTRKK